MPYDVETPAVRYNTDIPQEHYGKYRLVGPEYGQTIFGRYSLWKGNDKDLIDKAKCGLVYGAFPASVASFHSNAQHRGQFTVMSVAEKSFRHGTPWLIAGATYGVSVGILTHLRKKEDVSNHIAGGYAAGTMIGAWYKSPKLGFWTGVVMAIAAGMAKHTGLSEEENQMRNKQRLFNMYRRGWFTERPYAEGQQDAEMDVSFKDYRP